MERERVIAVDFDGTLCENKFPDVGAENKIVISELLEAQAEGAAIILWTCREGELLDKAVKWCYDRGIEFDAVNENLPRMIEEWGTNPRKLGATEFWDDRAVHKAFSEPRANYVALGYDYTHQMLTGERVMLFRCGACGHTIRIGDDGRCPYCGVLFCK